MIRLYTLFAVCSSLCAAAQDLKPLDYAKTYSSNGITQRICREVRYNSASADTITVGIAHFDAVGRMTEYHEFFAGGRLYAIYTYSYDGFNRMSSAQVRHTFYQMEPVDMRIEHDEKGRVTSLALTQPIRNFWMKQTFTYNEKGIMTRSEQWFDRNGVPTSLNRKDYPGYLGSGDNSLTHIFDQRGLELTHRFFNASGGVDKAWIYTYQ
jgi:hypothetical protein